MYIHVCSSYTCTVLMLTLYVHMQFERFELTPIIIFTPKVKKYMTSYSQKTIDKENLVRDPGFRHQKCIPHFSPKQLKFITASFNWDHTYNCTSMDIQCQ